MAHEQLHSIILPVWPSSKQGLEGKGSRCDSFTCDCFTLISCVSVGARVQGLILKQGKC